MVIEKIDDKSSNSPLTAPRLIDLIESQFSESQVSADTLIQHILESLNKHSSQYKYIVSVTSIDIPTESPSSCEIDNKFGASWNAKKDGFLTHVLEDKHAGKNHVVSVAWLSKWLWILSIYIICH